MFKITTNKVLVTLLFCAIVFVIMALSMDLTEGLIFSILRPISWVVFLGSETVGILLSKIIPGIQYELGSGGSLNFIILITQVVWMYILVCLGFWITGIIKRRI